MKFRYVAKDREGKKVKGSLNAETDHAVAEALIRMHLVPIDIEPDTGGGGGINFLRLFFKFGLPTTEDMMMFCRQMFSLTKAGVPLVRAIRVITISTTNNSLRAALNEVFTDLEGGTALAAAMSKHKFVFPSIVIALVSIGENSGSLDEVFHQLAIHFERESSTRKKIKAATRYPLLVIVVIVVAVGVINVVVIPAFSSFFKQFKTSLPLPTRILIAASDFTVNYWYIVLMIIFAIFMLITYWVNTAEGKMTWDKYKLKLPILGKIYKMSLLGRFARMFALCVRTGVPLLQSIQLIAASTDNVYVQEKIGAMRTDIEKGESLTASARNTGLFSDLVLQMMLISEETGETDRLFDEVGSFYEEEVDYNVNRLGSAIEPLLIAVIGGIVLVLALGVFLPMWNLSQVTMSRS